jgi:hypothetical protein
MESRKPLSVNCNGKKTMFTVAEGKMIQVILEGKKVNEKLIIEIIYP